MLDVAALGELLIDFTCLSTDENGYPTMAAHPGGAPANFLAALAKYGAKTAMLGKVGDDTFGRLLLDTLRRAGIETRGMIAAPDVFTTLAFVTLDARGEREFAFARKPGADTQLRWDEVDKSLIDEAKVFHFGTLSSTGEPARSATRAARAYALDCVEGRADPNHLTQENFSGYLFSRGVPDPDLIIRPSGELRLSNFLLWESAYAEFYFTDVLWPDFSKAELLRAIASYQSRARRFGGI